MKAILPDNPEFENFTEAMRKIVKCSAQAEINEPD